MKHSIKTAFERQTKAVTLKPSIGQNTAVTKAFLRDGLTCDIVDGKWKLVADMSEKWGGKEEGPTPGTYGRAALASCLVISYKMWAESMNIKIDELSVEVQADFDTRGMSGVDETKPGYLEMRYIVNIKSPEDEDTIIKLLDTADERSSYVDMFRNAQKVNRILNLYEEI